MARDTAASQESSPLAGQYAPEMPLLGDDAKPETVLAGVTVMIDAAEQKGQYCFVVPTEEKYLDGTQNPNVPGTSIPWQKKLGTWMTVLDKVKNVHSEVAEVILHGDSRGSLGGEGPKESKEDTFAKGWVRSMFIDPDVIPGTTWFEAITAETTFLQLSTEFRKLFLKYVQEDLNMNVTIKDSVDKDEIFLIVDVPTVADASTGQPAVADAVAESLRMRLPIKKEAYEKAKDNAGKKLTPQFDGEFFIPCYSKVTKEKRKKGDVYEDFRVVDLIRLCYSLVTDVFDLDAMLEKNMIVKHFPIHHYGRHDTEEESSSNFRRLKELTNFCKWFDRNWDWYIIPSTLPIPSGSKPQTYQIGAGAGDEHKIEITTDQTDDIARNYFGEEVGFMISFILFYCNCLRGPAFMGCVLYLRRYLAELEYIRMVQSLYAFCLALWAAAVCQTFVRREKVLIFRWGARAEDQGQAGRQTLRTYSEEDEFWEVGSQWGYIKTRLIRFSSYLIGCFIVGFIVAGIAYIQLVRHEMVHDPDEYVWLFKPASLIMIHHVYQKGDGDDLEEAITTTGPVLGAVMITLQIRIYDLLWDFFVRKIVVLENHRTLQSMNESMAVKLFLVKFFNQIYPYFYIAFMKEHIDKCKVAEKGGCVIELQQSLAIYFVSSAVIDALLMVFYWLKAIWDIQTEMAKATISENGRSTYTYLQVQAKMEPPWLMLDDMLTVAIQFAFVCCFTIAWPFMPTVALVYNIINLKMVLFRRLLLSQRCYPASVEGIPIWVGILKGSVYAACIMNTGIAVFTMKPLKDQDGYTKALAFIGIEHALILAVSAMFSVIPDTPKITERCGEYNVDHEYLLRQDVKEGKLVNNLNTIGNQDPAGNGNPSKAERDPSMDNDQSMKTTTTTTRQRKLVKAEDVQPDRIRSPSPKLRSHDGGV